MYTIRQIARITSYNVCYTKLLRNQLSEAGIKVSVFHLKDANLSEVAERMRESDGILIGSSTRYGDMVGNVEALLKMSYNFV